MTIQELIDKLLQVPESERHRPMYVRDFCEDSECDQYADNLPAWSADLHAIDEPHSDDNPMALNYCPNPQTCEHRGE